MDYLKENSQLYQNRPITVKHSLLPTEGKEPYSLMIKVVNDRICGRIGLGLEPAFGCEQDYPLTGEDEVTEAESLEKILISQLASAVVERQIGMINDN